VKRAQQLVALVTGASSGIGAAVATEYGRRGAAVVLAARRSDRLEQVSEAVEDAGGRALVVRCDVTRDGDPEAAVAAALEAFGRLDHVVANAGFGVAGAVHQLELEDYRRQFETNVFGVLRTARASRDALIASSGCLAIVGSVNGYVALPGVSAYCMSKHAVHALAASLRYEWARRGVAVVLVAPGFVASEIRRVDNRGRLHEHAREPIPPWLVMAAPRAARAMVRGIIRRRREVVITGHGKLIVSLQRHLPGLASFLIRRLGIAGRREAGG
jgi:NAD(P)-dependent dehydrogenase (short-subunit alcohol dehydrogenase family)